jgi:hypothetical protein
MAAGFLSSRAIFNKTSLMSVLTAAFSASNTINFPVACFMKVLSSKGRTYTNFWFVVRSAEISRISSGQGKALAIPKMTVGQGCIFPEKGEDCPHETAKGRSANSGLSA